MESDTGLQSCQVYLNIVINLTDAEIKYLY